MNPVRLTDLHSFFVYVLFGYFFIIPITLLWLKLFKIDDPKQRMNIYLLALTAPITGFILYSTVLIKRCQSGIYPQGMGWQTFASLCSLGTAAIRYLSPLLAVVLLLGLLKAVFASLLVLRMRRHAIVLPPAEGQRVDQLLRKQARLMGIGVPEIIFSNRSDFAAFSAGLIRPVVVISAKLLYKLDDHELEAVFTHELVHIRRGDSKINWLLHLLCGAMFFSPFSSILLKRYLLESERLCDQKTIEVTGNRREYAATLLKVWRVLVEEREFGSGLVTGLTGQKRDMETRITLLLNKTGRGEALPLALSTSILLSAYTVMSFFLGFLC